MEMFESVVSVYPVEVLVRESELPNRNIVSDGLPRSAHFDPGG